MKNTMNRLYDELQEAYGDLKWWPARNPFEVMVGAVLTQNTNWSNVESALTNFNDGLSPELIAELEPEELMGLIRPAGFSRQKSRYLKALTAWFQGYGYKVEAVRREPLADLREELRAVPGVGEETADAILLYAFGFPTFVVDAYTVRLCSRLPLEAGQGYQKIKASFEANLPRDPAIYNQFHALIVIHGKTHCRKQPLCGDCPLTGWCRKVGVEEGRRTALLSAGTGRKEPRPNGTGKGQRVESALEMAKGKGKGESNG